MLLLLACVLPSDTNVSSDPAAWEPACGPTDGAATEFHIDADSCEVTTPRATLMVETRDFAAGDSFSIADDSLYAWWSGEQPNPTAATLEILTIDGDVVTFSWSIDAVSGQAEAQFCDRPDLVCG